MYLTLTFILFTESLFCWIFIHVFEVCKILKVQISKVTYANGPNLDENILTAVKFELWGILWVSGLIRICSFNFDCYNDAEEHAL